MLEGSPEAEVTVIGSGLAGMAASIHLARAGLQVLCLESGARAAAPVGESLDWSAPALLTQFGFPMSWLIGERFATYKAKVTVQLADGSTRQYIPREWLASPPYNVELKTLHVDRVHLDAAIRSVMLNAGVAVLADRASKVERDGLRVQAVVTVSGRRIASRWFIDATGASALFPRAFGLPAVHYGPRKTAMWAYFDTADYESGTTLYMDGAPAYMEWIWEIPVRPHLVSVGYVAAGAGIADLRRKRLSVEDIFHERLARISRFAAMLRAAGPIKPNVTSFQCRVHSGLAGPNWAVIGESAAVVDPMTSNGVTAALRNASEAATLIAGARGRSQLPYLRRILYNRRIVDLARFFNCGIERTIYNRAIRNRLGVLKAGRIYTVPAWVLNAIYSRWQPRGLIATLAFSLVLNAFRLASVVLEAVCRVHRPANGASA
jgi:menaquinone-9 beta-reductase